MANDALGVNAPFPQSGHNRVDDLPVRTIQFLLAPHVALLVFLGRCEAERRPLDDVGDEQPRAGGLRPVRRVAQRPLTALAAIDTHQQDHAHRNNFV